MRVLLGIVAVGLLAGCSDDEAPAAGALSRRSDDPAPSTRVKTSPPSSGYPTGNLTGEVSSLAADVSALNVSVTDMGTVINLPADALFDYDKADLTPQAEEQLLKAAEIIRQSAGNGAIAVTGHSDSHGRDSYNLALSERRARKVADWFLQQVGVRKREFQVTGKGESSPIAPNTTPDGKDDPQGRAKNRRVEVLIPKVS